MVERIKDWISRFYLGLIILFLYAPIAVLIVLSFNSSRSRVVWGGFTLNWYSRLFSNRQIGEALSTTLIVALLSALIATVIGVLGALGIHAMREKNYQLVMVFTNIPMVNADIVTGIALMLWFVHFIPLGFGSVLLAHITFNIPYVILSVMPKIRQMNVSLYEAARDLGAGPVYGFFKVLLPQLAGGIVSGFFMAFTMSMDDFVITYFTKGPGVNTLSTMIYGEIRKGIKPEMYALSTLIFAFVFVILLAANYLPQRKKKTVKERR
ncbi:ABC transporter permease [Mediterraneibacter agrestimuris]|uniref:ABC transporter permease n=1 Tax=Mediterraneibacter agrestimuris TaxID=2941333 RepID=UPI00203B7162|nr:ABC transporter permease [Mediterraneibacter agrestimuris]